MVASLWRGLIYLITPHTHTQTHSFNIKYWWHRLNPPPGSYVNIWNLPHQHSSQQQLLHKLPTWPPSCCMKHLTWAVFKIILNYDSGLKFSQQNVGSMQLVYRNLCMNLNLSKRVLTAMTPNWHPKCSPSNAASAEGCASGLHHTIHHGLMHTLKAHSSRTVSNRHFVKSC